MSSVDAFHDNRLEAIYWVVMGMVTSVGFVVIGWVLTEMIQA